VTDAIARLLAERERLDHGLPTTLLLSLTGHLTLAGFAVALPLLLPHQPQIRVQEGFVAVLPRGGGGTPEVTMPPAPAPQPKPEPEKAAAPPAPPVILKPPPRAEPRPNALPLPDARAPKHPPTPPPVRATTKPNAAPSTGTAGTTPARSTASSTPGIELGLPPGPGVPTGNDSGGDWYLASVQQKIWIIWNQQVKSGYTQSVGVAFTILPDGNVTGVKVTQTSGSPLLDLAAQRAVQNAAPFAPLPREYGQNPRTIQALFKPTS